jgi:hypothetical protein
MSKTSSPVLGAATAATAAFAVGFLVANRPSLATNRLSFPDHTMWERHDRSVMAGYLATLDGHVVESYATTFSGIAGMTLHHVTNDPAFSQLSYPTRASIENLSTLYHGARKDWPAVMSSFNTQAATVSSNFVTVSTDIIAAKPLR